MTRVPARPPESVVARGQRLVSTDKVPSPATAPPSPPQPRRGDWPDLAYIRELRLQMRHASRQAALASARWARRDRQLTAQHREPADLLVAKRDDLELRDHYEMWSYYERECSRLAAVIAAELAALTLLGEDHLEILGEHLAAVSRWIDDAPANAARDPEAKTRGRLAKVAEECGEVIAAYIGETGQNPRKGLTMNEHIPPGYRSREEWIQDLVEQRRAAQPWTWHLARWWSIHWPAVACVLLLVAAVALLIVVQVRSTP